MNKFNVIKTINLLDYGKFSDFPSKISQEDKKLRLFLQQPGIFGVHCVVTNRIYFQKCFNLDYCLASLTGDLRGHLFYACNDLAFDCDHHGFDSINYLILAIGNDCNSSEKRELKLREIKQNCPYELYEETCFE